MSLPRLFKQKLAANVLIVVESSLISSRMCGYRDEMDCLVVRLKFSGKDRGLLSVKDAVQRIIAERERR